MVDTAPETTFGAEDVLWDLSCYYQGIDDPAIDSDMTALRERAGAWEARYRGRVAQLSAAEISEALAEYEALFDGLGRLESFASLTYTTDTLNPAHGALMQKVQEFEAEFRQKLLFFDLEWNALDDEAAARILNDPAIGKYRHHLESQRRYKPHELSEAEEKLLLETAVTGRQAWIRLFTQIWSSARFDLNGEKLTISQIMAKLQVPEREIRHAAADSMTATLREKLPEVAYIFNVIAADKAADDRRRRYTSWVASRNLDNKAAPEIVEALVSAVTSSYDIVHGHYELKRKLLGYDKLYEYDRAAPLPVAEDSRIYSWGEAREMVQSAYSAFSPQLGDLVRRFFDERWIHAALLPNKRSGAYANPGVPSAHPFIFMNYTGTSRDIKTLAHELGHGVHMYLCNERQGVIGSDMRLTVAEMASVFGETMVFDDLMKREADPASRLSMLSQMMEDSIGTVFRQVAMNRFEDRLHNARRAQGELTADQMSDLWMETQRPMYGDSLELRDEYRLWWTYIPHFIHTPGYVYAYAFGKLLALALYNLYQQRGAEFVPAYLEILAAGDSDYPENIFATVGLDLANPAFWQEGLNTLRQHLAQEEQLAREVFPEKFA